MKSSIIILSILFSFSVGTTHAQSPLSLTYTSPSLATTKKNELADKIKKLEQQITPTRTRLSKQWTTVKTQETKLTQLIEKREGWIKKIVLAMDNAHSVSDRTQLQRLIQSIRKERNEEGVNTKFIKTVVENKTLPSHELQTLSLNVKDLLREDVVHFKNKQLDLQDARGLLNTAGEELQKTMKAIENAKSQVRLMNTSNILSRSLNNAYSRYFSEAEKAFKTMQEAQNEATIYIKSASFEQ